MPGRRLRASVVFAAAALVLAVGPVCAQNGGLEDRPFRGTVSLDVDATDTDHRIFSVRETIPVQSAGDTILLYPEWEPASHAPTASPIGLAGLYVMIDGRSTDWRRDPLDVHAFHVGIPARARRIELAFQFLAPRSAALLRPDMIDVQWERLLFYPAGVRDIHIATTLKAPRGLEAFTSLSRAGPADGKFAFKTETLERLIDAPVYAARYGHRFDLAASPARPVVLDVVADDPKDIAPSRMKSAACARWSPRR